jgi:hypothetical protein
MEVLFGLFEFEALAFFSVHPFLKLVERGIHGMISFRLRSTLLFKAYNFASSVKAGGSG